MEQFDVVVDESKHSTNLASDQRPLEIPLWRLLPLVGGDLFMSTIEGKHWYRFNFLKSEKWETIRLEALVKFDATCGICGLRDLGNDVHHIWYDKIDEPEENQLTVLCREHHDKIHELLEPCSAHTPDSKQAALFAFKNAKRSIQRTLPQNKSEKPCQACGHYEAFRLDPITRAPGPDGKGMSLCTSCQAIIFAKIPQMESGNTQMWDFVKTIIRDIRSEVEKAKAEKRLSVLERIKPCLGIPIETLRLTCLQDPHSLSPMFETISYRADSGVGWMSKV